MRQHKPSSRQDHISSPFSLNSLTTWLVGGLFVTCFFGALPASADWLLLKEHGKMIETQGPWKVQGSTLTYTDAKGEEQRIATAKVDLVKSEKLTAMRSAKPFVPQVRPKAEAPNATKGGASKPGQVAKADPEEPKVILYRTTWCGYCKKTADLLNTLGVAFVEKDIEADAAANAEYRQKAGGYSGIPLTDINGQVVRGFKVNQIQNLVLRLKQQEAAAKEAQSGSGQ